MERTIGDGNLMGYRIVITQKKRSKGGGNVTVGHLISGLTAAGFEVYPYLVPEVNDISNLPNFVNQVKPQAIIFDDISRFSDKVASHVPVNILLVVGMPNVHKEYFFHSGLFNLSRNFSAVFVRQKSLAELLQQWYGNKVFYWPGSVQPIQTKAIGYLDPCQHKIQVGSFNQGGYWKNPIINTLVAFSLYRKYKNICYFKIGKTNLDVVFSSNNHFPIRGPNSTIGRSSVLEKMASVQLGIELALADAFPRVVSEMFCLGVPCLISPTVEHVTSNKFLHEALVVSSPNNILEARDKGLRLLENRNKWQEVSAACKEYASTLTVQKETDAVVSVLKDKLSTIKAVPLQVIISKPINIPTKSLSQKVKIVQQYQKQLKHIPPLSTRRRVPLPQLIQKKRNVGLSSQKVAAINIKKMTLNFVKDNSKIRRPSNFLKK